MKFFAFWEYDQFPYLIGSEILKMLENGKVKVKGYPGYAFTPVFIVPIETGKKIKTYLDCIKEEYFRDLNILKRDYSNRTEEILQKYVAVFKKTKLPINLFK